MAWPVPDADAVSLPRTFGDAVRAEFGRALRPPYATLSTVAANGIFMSVAWFLLPRTLKDDLFTYTVIWIGVVPFGALGIAAWVGIFFPYHPMPLRFRWEHRRPRWRMLWRWLALLLTPYILVPSLAIAPMTPSLLLWGFTSAHGLSRKLPDHDLGLGIALACAVAIGCSFASHRWGVMIAERRRAKLLAFLADPTRG